MPRNGHNLLVTQGLPWRSASWNYCTSQNCFLAINANLYGNAFFYILGLNGYANDNLDNLGINVLDPKLQSSLFTLQLFIPWAYVLFHIQNILFLIEMFHPLPSLPHFLTPTLWSLWSLGELFPLLRGNHFLGPQPHPKISWCPNSTSVFLAFDCTTHVHLNLNNGSLTTIYIFRFYIWVVMQLPKPKQPWRLMLP